MADESGEVSVVTPKNRVKPDGKTLCFFDDLQLELRLIRASFATFDGNSDFLDYPS